MASTLEGSTVVPKLMTSDKNYSSLGDNTSDWLGCRDWGMCTLFGTHLVHFVSNAARWNLGGKPVCEAQTSSHPGIHGLGFIGPCTNWAEVLVAYRHFLVSCLPLKNRPIFHCMLFIIVCMRSW